MYVPVHDWISSTNIYSCYKFNELNFACNSENIFECVNSNLQKFNGHLSFTKYVALSYNFIQRLGMCVEELFSQVLGIYSY